MSNLDRKLSIPLGQSTKKRTSIAIVACALALGIILAALLILTPAAGAQSSQQTVSIQDFFFSPAQITVQPGTKVTWVNRGNAPHTVTADDGSFDSETLRPGQSFSHTFQNPGTVAYHCEIHPSMKGSVTVSGGVKGGAATGGTQAKAGGAQAKAGGSAPMQRLPNTGGPSLILPTITLSLGAGALGWAILRQRSS